MHHGTCVTHVPWCMSGSLPAVAGKTFPAFPAHAHPQFYVSGKRPIGLSSHIQLPLDRLCENSSWTTTFPNVSGGPPYWRFQRYGQQLNHCTVATPWSNIGSVAPILEQVYIFVYIGSWRDRFHKIIPHIPKILFYDQFTWPSSRWWTSIHYLLWNVVVILKVWTTNIGYGISSCSHVNCHGIQWTISQY